MPSAFECTMDRFLSNITREGYICAENEYKLFKWEMCSRQTPCTVLKEILTIKGIISKPTQVEFKVQAKVETDNLWKSAQG